MEREIDRLSKENILQQAQIEERLKWSTFWAIIVLLVSIFVSVIGSMYSVLEREASATYLEVDELNKKYDDVAISQAKIDVQYVEIQKTLAEIKLQLSKIK